MKYAHLDPDVLRFYLDSSFTKEKKAQILADVQKNGIRNPISVRYDGNYVVTWGASRAWAGRELQVSVPAVVFEAMPGAEGEEIADPTVLFDCPVNFKPHKALIAPMDQFWN